MKQTHHSIIHQIPKKFQFNETDILCDVFFSPSQLAILVHVFDEKTFFVLRSTRKQIHLTLTTQKTTSNNSNNLGRNVY